MDHRYRRPAVRVVSFNLRNARAVDGWNSWPFRRRATAAVLRDLAPDVAGLQEAYACQERYLVRALGGYSSVSVGRAAGDRGERCPVVHRSSTLRLVSSRKAEVRCRTAHRSPRSRAPRPTLTDE